MAKFNVKGKREKSQSYSLSWAGRGLPKENEGCKMICPLRAMFHTILLQGSSIRFPIRL